MSDRPRVLNPSDIELLLHTYYSPASHPDIVERYMQAAKERLISLNLAKVSPANGLETTKRGQAYCEAVMRTPLPEAVWAIGDEIYVR